MSRKKPWVRYELDSGDIRSLTNDEIKVILRSADESFILKESLGFRYHHPAKSK